MVRDAEDAVDVTGGGVDMEEVEVTVVEEGLVVVGEDSIEAQDPGDISCW